MQSSKPIEKESIIINALEQVARGQYDFRLDYGSCPLSPAVIKAFNDLADRCQSMYVQAADGRVLVQEAALVLNAVAQGDFSKRIDINDRGEFAELRGTINSLVEKLNRLSIEVSRVAREVGAEGLLGGQAFVPGVEGSWKDLTDSVNFMASSLTSQVRGIASVVTNVAKGNLHRKLVLTAKGEIAELTDTINEMIDTLALFTDQVSSVAREVGIEGRLGAQARVPSASGVWSDLTDNVNRLAANLTTQVRAMADVADAVAKGDLTREIKVEAAGEVGVLKDRVNAMIYNLRETTVKNQEQDWLKTNIAHFAQNLQGQRSYNRVLDYVFSQLADLISLHQGSFYLLNFEEDEPFLQLASAYACDRQKIPNRISMGSGLIGQAAIDRKPVVIKNLPSEYFSISSSLGEVPPKTLAIYPIEFEGLVKGVIEIASLEELTEIRLALIQQLANLLGIVLNTIQANSQTEILLAQSQNLATELQAKQIELEGTNNELAERARLMAAQKEQVEEKSREIEIAHKALEDKAEQLALTSKYKSQFLANMSHELRTPLNSLLVLSQILAENAEGNLTDTDVDFARTIHTSGSELLVLINDILDLSKIESGTIQLDVRNVDLRGMIDDVSRTLQPIVAEKPLDFVVHSNIERGTKFNTDVKRVNQILKNLLSNAFKFTEDGLVTLTVDSLNRDGVPMVSFAVADTGIGIPKDKLDIIFEAFQQADGTTSRKYGGTGLGLTISRQLAQMLGGDIRVESEPGKGSTFTLTLPLQHKFDDNLVSQNLEPIVKPPSKAKFDAELTIPEGQFNINEMLGDSDRLVLNQRDFDSVRILQEAQAQEAHARELKMSTSNPKVHVPVALIVEEAEALSSALHDLSRQSGFIVFSSDNPDDAIALSARHKPDAIILDAALSEGNGWALLSAFKSASPNSKIHIFSSHQKSSEPQKKGVYLEFDNKVAMLFLKNHFNSLVLPSISDITIIEPAEKRAQLLAKMLGESSRGENAKVTILQTCKKLDESMQDARHACVLFNLKGLDDLTILPTIKGRMELVGFTIEKLPESERLQIQNALGLDVDGSQKDDDLCLDDGFFTEVGNFLLDLKDTLSQ